MLSFLAGERGKGKPRPNRRAIEAHIRNTLKFNQKELDDHLEAAYDDLAGLGILRARDKNFASLLEIMTAVEQLPDDLADLPTPE